MSSEVHQLEPLPSNNSAWARQVQQRLRRLEGSTQSLRVGDWVLIAKDGALTANKPGIPPIPLASAPDADQPAGPDRSATGLPAEMPEQWWEALWDALSGGTSDNTWLDQFAAYLDDMWASLWSGWTTIPASAIVATSREMLWNPDFTGDIALDGGTEWVLDDTVYLDNLTGGTQYSAKLVMDGLPHSMRSNVMNVAPGQTIDLSASIAALGLTVSSGTPIGIGVATYDANGVRTATVIVSSRGSVTGPIIGWVGLDAAARTANLTGSYTVPSDGSVAKVAMVVQVGVEATGGTLWVDKASMKLGGLIPQSLVDGLNQLWEGLFSGFGTTGQDQLNTAWNNLLSMFGLGKPALVSGGFDRNAQLQTWAMDILGPLGVFLTPEYKSAQADLTHAVLIYLFGGSINDVPVAGWSQTALDNMAQAWHNLLDLFTIAAGDRPDMSNLWAALANPILKMVGLPTVDLPSQLDSAIPQAPTLLWPLGGGSTTTSVPQNVTLYYVATAVNTTTLKESAPSNEVSIWSAPSFFGSKNKVLNSWLALPAGHTLSLYRRTSPTGQYRKVASGLTGTSATDVDPSTTITAQPGSAAASTAGVINGISDKADAAKTSANGIQASLYGGTPSAPAPVAPQIVSEALPDIDINGTPTPIASAVTGANAAAAGAQQNAQGVIDAINNAASGANTVGTSIDNVLGNLQRFPQNNIKVNPAAGSNAAVAFDAAGAGASTGPFSLTQYGTSVSWSHTVGASGNYIFIAAYYPAPLATGSPSFSAVATPAGGGAPIQITAVDFTSAPADLVILAAPIDPGTYTITLTCRISGVGVTAPGFIANSASYTNVNTATFVESPTTAGGYSTSGTNSTPMSFSPQAQTDADPKGMYVNVFGNASTSASGAISSYAGGTSRLNKSATIGSGGMGLVLGDVVPNGSNESFSAQAASVSNNIWQGVGFLLESDSSTVGSFMELSRQTTGDFQAGSATVMPTPIPDNTYDTIVRHTDDLTAVGGNTTNQFNGIKVSLAGTYILTIQHVWGSNTLSKLATALGVNKTAWPAGIASASANFKCVPLINGAQVPVFMPGSMAFPIVSPGTTYATLILPVFTASCVLYLKPGDVVSWAGGFDAFFTAGPTYTVPFDIAGIATNLTMMSLALCNRSLL